MRFQIRKDSRSCACKILVGIQNFATRDVDSNACYLVDRLVEPGCRTTKYHKRKAGWEVTPIRQLNAE